MTLRWQEENSCLTLDEIRLCYGDFIMEYHQAFIRGLTFLKDKEKNNGTKLF
jgi:hypothetical protein